MIDKIHYISQKTSEKTHLENIEKALISGCKWIQLRVKNEADKVVEEYAFRAKDLCSTFNARLIINDYPLVAKKVGSDGLHLGLSDMSIEEARAIVGPSMLIGGTANTFDDVVRRVQEKADYIGLGPYRFTRTKENLSPVLGPDGYRSILEKTRQAGISIPLIAIGGILLEDVAALIEIGLHGVAISGAISQATDAEKVVASLYSLVAANSQNETCNSRTISLC